MARKKMNQHQHKQIAEQIILGQKGWEDFQFPTQDDRLHVKAIVDRGVQALGEGHRKVKQKVKREFGGAVTIQEFVMGHSLADILSTSDCTPFVFDRLSKESKPLRRQLYEKLSCELSPEEFSALLAADGAPFKEVAKKKELERLPSKTVEPPPYGLASAVALKFMEKQEGVSEEAAAYLIDYRRSVGRQLDEQCKHLYGLLGLGKTLNGFSPEQWRRLVGLTPRDQLGTMAFAVPDKTLEKMAKMLPERQQNELQELITWKERERERRLETFGDAQVALKKWVGLVNRVGREA